MTTGPTAVGPLTPEQALEVVRVACAVVLEIDPAGIGRQTRFAEDLQADSLALVGIVEVLEAELSARLHGGFRVADDELDVLTTVGQAVDLALART